VVWNCPFGGELFFGSFILWCFFLCFIFKPARIALARFLLSNSPDQGSYKGKTFEKKIRSPTPARRASDKKNARKIFFSKPVGLGLDV